MSAARNNQAACAECHGSDYQGGIAPTSCHGASLEGVDGSGPSCTSCHLGGALFVHPADWGTSIDSQHGAYVSANGNTVCSNAACHEADLAGVTNSGPGCVSCHVSGAFPFTATGCVSCHAKPPSGTTAPNRSGAHAAHNALTNVKNVCDGCHNGAGSMTACHADGAIDVQFTAAFNAKSGTAGYAAGSGACSKVSCHGGQTSPAWSSGTMDVNAECTSCHTYGTTEYNSFVSGVTPTGGHDLHVNWAHFACDKCHDTTKLAVGHLTTVNTTTMEDPASATIKSSFSYSGGSCTPNCHVTRTW